MLFNSHVILLENLLNGTKKMVQYSTGKDEKVIFK